MCCGCLSCFLPPFLNPYFSTLHTICVRRAVKVYTNAPLNENPVSSDLNFILNGTIYILWVNTFSGCRMWRSDFLLFKVRRFSMVWKVGIYEIKITSWMDGNSLILLNIFGTNLPLKRHINMWYGYRILTRHHLDQLLQEHVVMCKG